jgi:hypothetical protein
LFFELFFSRNFCTALFFVFDASDVGWSFVELDSEGKVVHIHPPVFFFHPPVKWSATMSRLHIFILEAYAAAEAMKYAQGKYPDHPVTLVVDNTALAGAMVRGYTPCKTAMRYLRPIIEISMTIVTVPSKYNIADTPSRLKNHTEEERRILTWKAIQEHHRGVKIGTADSAPMFTGMLRHCEPSDESMLGPDVVMDECDDSRWDKDDGAAI